MGEQYDVVVIGAGPGGYVAAIRASQLGQKTAIVDRQWLGGVCLNVGCIPSKALLRNAEIAHTLRERGKEFGFSFENLVLDFSVAAKRSRQVSDRLVKGVGFLMKKNNITVHMGTAKLTAPDTVAVTSKDGQVTELKTRNIIVATGASSAVPGAWKVNGGKVRLHRQDRRQMDQGDEDRTGGKTHARQGGDEGHPHDFPRRCCQTVHIPAYPGHDPPDEHQVPYP